MTMTPSLIPVVPARQHFGIIRANYTSVEWVMKNGGGWSLSSKVSNRANFISFEHATEVLEKICRLYHWGNECLTVVPLDKNSVTDQLPDPTPLSDKINAFAVTLDCDGHSEWLAKRVEDVRGWYLTTDFFEAYQFGSYDQALKATEGDKNLVIEPLTVNDIHYLEGTTFVVLRESEMRQDGYSVCVTEYLSDFIAGEVLIPEFNTDINQRYEFDSFEEAQEAMSYLQDSYLVIVPIAPKPLSPAAIASAENLVSELLRG